MESLLQDIIALLISVGPWIVLAVAFSETAVFVGLVLPAEATVLVAAFLADRGVFPVEQILAAAFLGGLLGDQTGYLLGRYGGGRMVTRGRLGRLWSRYEPATGALFRRHSALAVTLARLPSFVRTLMPWFAGMSRLPYLRFLGYDCAGVLLWAGGSVALGYLAGESWRLIAGALGTFSAAVLALIVLVLVFLAFRRGRARIIEG